MEINDIINSTNILKGLGYLFLLIVLSIIAYLNGYHLKDKRSLFIFALITCLIFSLLPFGVNRDCEGQFTEYFCLGYIDDNMDDYEEAEKIGISLQRSFWNIIIVVIFFGFITNAIAVNLAPGGKTAFTGKSGGSGYRYSSTPKAKGSDNFKNLAVQLASPFSTLVYMAIFIIIINVISNLYIYFNCEDKQNDYNVRSFILGQYNVILITIVGLVIYGVARSNNSRSSSK